MNDIRSKIVEAVGKNEANAQVVLASLERQLEAALDLVRLLRGEAVTPRAPSSEGAEPEKAPIVIETLGGASSILEE